MVVGKKVINTATIIIIIIIIRMANIPNKGSAVQVIIGISLVTWWLIKNDGIRCMRAVTAGIWGLAETAVVFVRK